MPLELVSDRRSRTFKDTHDGFNLNFSLETEGNTVKSLNCHGNKPVPPPENGEPVISVMPTGVNFGWQKGWERPTATATNAILTESLQVYVKDQFDAFVAAVENGTEIVPEGAE